MFPAAALAGSKVTYDVEVRNLTAAPALIQIKDSAGYPTFFEAPVGISSISMEEGMYDYWVSSSCGNSAGVWNLSRNKILWIECGDNVPSAKLIRWDPPVDLCRTNAYVPYFLREALC